MFNLFIYTYSTCPHLYHSIQADLGCPGGVPLLLLIRNPHTHHHLSY